MAKAKTAKDVIQVAVDLSGKFAVQAKGNPANIVAYGTAAAVVFIGAGMGYGGYVLGRRLLSSDDDDKRRTVGTSNLDELDSASVPLGRKVCCACDKVSFDRLVLCPSCSEPNWWREA